MTSLYDIIKSKNVLSKVRINDKIKIRYRKDKKTIAIRTVKIADYNKAMRSKNIETQNINMEREVRSIRNKYIKSKNELLKYKKQTDKMIKQNKLYKAEIYITIEGVISDKVLIRKCFVNNELNGREYYQLDNTEEMDRLYTKAGRKYYRAFGGEYVKFIDSEISIYNKKGDKNILQQRMKSTFPMNIATLFNTKIDMNDKNESCVLDYIIKKYNPTVTTKKQIIKTFENICNMSYKEIIKQGINCDELIKFCLKYQIGLMIFDINAKQLYKQIYEHRKNTIKNLTIITYNGHMYTIRKIKLLERLKIKQAKKDECIYIENVKEELIKTNKNGQCIEYINIDKNIIYGYTSEGKTYKSKTDKNDIITSILKKLSIEELNINHDIVTSKLIDCIEGLYKKENVESFMPVELKLNAVLYSNGIKYDNKNKTIRCIDKNKCYASSCAKLNYLIKCNYITDNIYKCNNDVDIIEHYFYLIKPHVKQYNELGYNILIEKSINIYTGEYIKMLTLENIQFDILEYISTEKINDNHYKNMFEDLLVNYQFTKEEMDILKLSYCMHFENMNKGIINENKQKFDNIYTYDDKTEEGYNIKVCDDLYIKYHIEKNTNITLTNRKPINYQLKQQTRQDIYNKCKNMNIQFKDLIEINTDSIVYYTNNNIKININQNNINNSLYGWKDTTAAYIDKAYRVFEPNTYSKITSLFETSFKNNENNVLCVSYAGSGKSYHIMAEIDEQLTKESEDYIILCPNHKLNSEYKNKNYNSVLIHHFEFNEQLIYKELKNKVIYIDEIGLYSKKQWMLIYKMSIITQCKLYGDYNQMLSYDNQTEHAYNKLWIKDLYDIEYINKNSRNTFDKKYYNSLIKNTNKKELLAEIRKYQSGNYYDKDTQIITFYKKTCEYYNELMYNRLFPNSKYKFTNKGEKIICHSNELRKDEIYNNAQYYINKLKDNNTTEIINVDDSALIHTLTNDQILKNFKHSYAININKIQGSSLSKYYFSDMKDYKHMIQDDDKYYNCYNALTGRMAYTIISRIKLNYNIVKEHWKNNVYDNDSDLNVLHFEGIIKDKVNDIKYVLKDDSNKNDYFDLDDMFN